LAPLARQMNKHSGETPLAVEIGVAANHPSVSVKPLQGVKSKSAREPGGPAAKLALSAQEHRRWHQLLAGSSTVRELANDVYQLAEREKRVLRKQAAKKKLTTDEVKVLEDLGRLREIADEVTRQRAASFALEDEAVIAFHESIDASAAELSDRLA